jgi:CRP-like cAMP-binding protein
MERLYTDGATIATQGEMGEEMYVIVSGEVSVKAGEKEVARRKTGDVVGEMAIISREPRIASLVALGDVRTLCLDRQRFEGLLRERPETSLAVMRVLCARLKELSK